MIPIHFIGDNLFILGWGEVSLLSSSFIPQYPGINNILLQSTSTQTTTLQNDSEIQVLILKYILHSKNERILIKIFPMAPEHTVCREGEDWDVYHAQLGNKSCFSLPRDSKLEIQGKKKKVKEEMVLYKTGNEKHSAQHNTQLCSPPLILENRTWQISQFSLWFFK